MQTKNHKGSSTAIREKYFVHIHCRLLILCTKLLNFQPKYLKHSFFFSPILKLKKNSLMVCGPDSLTYSPKYF